jgi:hypothetical protein
MTEPERHGASTRPADPQSLPLPWMADFLATLSETGNVRLSCRLAGVSQTTAYDARKAHPEFAAEWQAAIQGKEYGRPDFRRQLPALLAAPPAGPFEPGGDWRERFAEALAETSSVIAAAMVAGIAPQTAYRLRRTDPAFAADWLAALHEGYDHLEMELLGYLRDPAPGRRMDVAAALRLLAAHREVVERRRAMEEDQDEQALLDSIDQFIDDMRVRREANTAILADGPVGDGDE